MELGENDNKSSITKEIYMANNHNMSTQNRNLLLHISGGLGKVIMSTAVIRSYKQKYPNAKIVVVSGYPEVYVNNPDVYRFYSFNTPYLWQDYYGKSDWKVYAQDPYFNESWIKDEEIHLIDVWCKELGIPSTQKTPLLFFSGPELDELNSMITVNLPLMVVQSTGGSNPKARSWTRNIPQNELEEYLKRYQESHFIVHLALPETPVLQNIHQRIDSLDRRKAMCLVYFAHAVVGIDSFALHTRAANPEKGMSVFFFPLTKSVSRLGYSGIKMITPVTEVQKLIEEHHDYYATVFRLGIENDGSNCPIPGGIKWFEI